MTQTTSTPIYHKDRKDNGYGSAMDDSFINNEVNKSCKYIASYVIVYIFQEERNNEQFSNNVRT